MHKYKELKIWQKAVDLATEVYKCSNKFPREEKYGLCQQIQRSAVSIPSNIAEGAGRNSNGEFKNFLGIAIGSCFELETQLIIAKTLDYLNQEEVSELSKRIEEIQKMSSVLIKTLNETSNTKY